MVFVNPINFQGYSFSLEINANGGVFLSIIDSTRWKLLILPFHRNFTREIEDKCSCQILIAFLKKVKEIIDQSNVQRSD